MVDVQYVTNLENAVAEVKDLGAPAEGCSAGRRIDYLNDEGRRVEEDLDEGAIIRTTGIVLEFPSRSSADPSPSKSPTSSRKAAC
jgi:hypothetical protein